MTADRPPREQRRGRRIAMTPDERDEFLRAQRTCRVATVGGDGEAMWLNTLVRSQRWTNLERDPRVSVLVDAGEDYFELQGVELLGRVERVGSAPRVDEPDPALEVPERLFGEKYTGGQFFIDGAHAWMRLVPEKIVSWDFTKLGQG